MSTSLFLPLLLLCGVLLSPHLRAQEVDVWPGEWFSDLPSVDMTGRWAFDPDSSDEMPAPWEGQEIYYEINQQGAFVVLDFKVGEGQSNIQRYSWNGTIERFNRGGREVEEAARWTDAGRVLEIAGRHWDPDSPSTRTDYRFTYEVRGDELTFTQANDTGETVWRFRRERRAPENQDARSPR